LKELTKKQKVKYIDREELLRGVRRGSNNPTQVHGKEKYTRKEKHKTFYV
jgi:hypothetical protein